MPAERQVLPRDIRKILEWAEKWRAIPTRKQIAREVGVSEATVSRIVRDGGYVRIKNGRRVEGTVSSIALKRSLEVPRLTASEQNESLQGDGCLTAQP